MKINTRINLFCVSVDFTVYFTVEKFFIGKKSEII
jgi:hypothetical protein